MNKYGFSSQLRIGGIGEVAVAKYLADKYGEDSVLDVRKDKEFQGKDIDYCIKKGRKKFSLDVKTDTYYHTGNYFFETVSNETKGTPGCFLSSEADFWYYLFVPQNELHIIPMKKVRKWFLKNQNNFKSVKLCTGTKDGYYRTVGYKVPKLDVPGIKIIQL